MNTDPQPAHRAGDPAGSRGVGIKAEIKALAQPEVIAAGGNKDQSPLIWSGGMGWIADFPDPSDFYGPILGCGGAVHGRLELVLVLRQERSRTRAPRPTPCRSPSRRRHATRSGRRSSRISRRKHAPWVPGVQRAACRRQIQAHGRPGRDLYRSDPRDRLRGDLREEVAAAANTPRQCRWLLLAVTGTALLLE